MPELDVACTLCGETFSSEKELQDHEQSAHSSQLGRRRARPAKPEPDDLDEEETVA